MDISFQQINYLIHLAEHRHFGKAAMACHVTQPTLSMQIKKAEEQLGGLIFDRKQSPLELTPFGKKLLPNLHEIQAEFDRLKLLSARTKGSLKNELRIGIIPTVSAYLVPELFAHRSLFSEHVRWSFRENKTEDVLDLLEKRKIDLAILAGPVNQDQFVSFSLYNEEIMAYTKSTEKKLPVEELELFHPWFLNQGNCLRTQMIHFCGLQDKRPADDWDYQGGNLEMLISMVDHYGGYTLVPAFYRRAYPVKPAMLKHLYADQVDVFPARHIIALYRPRDTNKPEIKQLLAFIKTSFANNSQQRFEVLSWD